ncbi:MAG: ABC transporter permease [Lachnospiraceae bacterium]|nr:ABC transporter permease [Lachnospiraceae bacterium]
MSTSKVSAEQISYLKEVKRKKQFVLGMQLAILLFFLGLWELAADLNWIDDFVFSSPSRIVKTCIDLSVSGELLKHTGITLYETILSFLITTGGSIFIAMLLWISPTVSKILEPYLVMLNSLPKSALAPLLIVWLGTGARTIIVAGISVAIFGGIINLYTTFRGTDREKEKLIYTLGGKKYQVLFKVVLPAGIPAIISNMKVNVGLSLVGVIIGEFLAARAGLGYLIIYGSQVYKLDWVMMSIILLCIMAVVFYQFIGVVERRYQ